MKKRFLLAAILSVFMASCALFDSEPSIYDPSSFTKLSWAKHSFEEMKARCRHTSMHKDGVRHYEIQRPVYKACMEHYGYHYKGHSEVSGNDDPSYTRSRDMHHMIYPDSDKPINQTVKDAFPEQSSQSHLEEDKSALYR